MVRISKRQTGSTVIRFAVGKCALGLVLVASTDKGICAVMLGDKPDVLVQDLQKRFPRAEFVGGDKAFEKIVAQVVGLVEHPRKELVLPLDLHGTAFQCQVWQALQKIPLGKTATYAEIAWLIRKPTAMRAVAQACGANKIAVAIPCHRVIRTDGSLSGYRWGVDRKAKLLQWESEG